MGTGEIYSVIMPAVQRQRPELNDKVQLLRSEPPEDGTTTFIFHITGGSITDYDLTPLFVAEYGEQEGQRLLQTWQDMFTEQQHGWTLHQVSLNN